MEAREFWKMPGTCSCKRWSLLAPSTHFASWARVEASQRLLLISQNAGNTQNSASGDLSSLAQLNRLWRFGMTRWFLDFLLMSLKGLVRGKISYLELSPCIHTGGKPWDNPNQIADVTAQKMWVRGEIERNKESGPGTFPRRLPVLRGRATERLRGSQNPKQDAISQARKSVHEPRWAFFIQARPLGRAILWPPLESDIFDGLFSSTTTGFFLLKEKVHPSPEWNWM